MKAKISLLFVLLAATISAQIPGYMGKRLVVGYSTYCMLGFKGPGAFSSSPADEGSFTFNNAHCLNLEYVYKTNKMVCISTQYILTGLAYDNGKTNGLFGDTFRSANETPYPGGYKYMGDFATPAKLRSFNIDIGYKKFRKGFLAPVGKYLKLDVLMMFEKLTYDYKNFGKIDPNGYSSSDYIKSDLGTSGVSTFRNMAFGCTFGNQKILNDVIVLDYGIRFAYSPALNIINVAAGDEFTNSIDSYFRRAGNLRMAREQLVNFHLGIGFLAF